MAATKGAGSQSQGGGGKGGGGQNKGGGVDFGKIGGWSSKTENPSGDNRFNNPPKRKP